MITIKAIFENGDEVVTRMNATFQDAQNYYLNRTFNLGCIEDDMQRCVEVREV